MLVQQKGRCNFHELRLTQAVREEEEKHQSEVLLLEKGNECVEEIAGQLSDR